MTRFSCIAALVLSACATGYNPPPDCPGCATYKGCPKGTVPVVVNGDPRGCSTIRQLDGML